MREGCGISKVLQLFMESSATLVNNEKTSILFFNFQRMSKSR